jgi:hypothetical protein
MAAAEVTEHGEGLSGAGLSVGEDGGVLSLEEGVDVSPADGVVDLLLLAELVEDHIERVFIIPIVDHVLVITDARWILRGFEPAEDFDVAAFLPDLFFNFGLNRAIIIGVGLDEGVREMYGDLLHILEGSLLVGG